MFSCASGVRHLRVVPCTDKNVSCAFSCFAYPLHPHKEHRACGWHRFFRGLVAVLWCYIDSSLCAECACMCADITVVFSVAT